ncbi:hypothetical protein JM946_10535 [Steroidobacter sp. S1-65]|uniref:Uncharacterized protein n=1 Tax=Steroidobacter gossypii TaxID=2805490 RepID=A0ABS1WW33_9GAMM|nr:hypothetical protein [Steroidobacter gossypii]MBM0105191.1 hypothetical protein [Steroidobacter gossypii]
MNKPTLYGTIALGAIIAGALYLNSADRNTEAPASTPQAGSASLAPNVRSDATSSGGTFAPPDPVGQSRHDSTPPADPRLAALAVSPANDLLEFVTDGSGKVIAEIDKDPASISFKKPLREYTYAGERIIGVTVYRYLPDHVEISRTRVAYKPDGSVDEFAQTTSYSDSAMN